MKLNRGPIQIVLVLFVSLLAVSSALALASYPNIFFTDNITSTGPPPNVTDNDTYSYLPIVSRNFPVAGAWLEVGTGSASGGSISAAGWSYGKASIAIAPDGTPYLAWHDDSSGQAQIYVMRWNGAIWEEVGTGSASSGGISNTSGSSWWPAIAIAPNGTPYVTWEEQYSEIYVRRWNGAIWEELGAGSASGGGISDTDWPSFTPSVAIAPDGTPYVTWTEIWARESQIYVRRWNGSSWEEAGAGSASGGGISSNPTYSEVSAIAIDPDGRPYVTWDDCGWYSDCEIYVLGWNGSSWEEVGPGSAGGGGMTDNETISKRPSIAVAPNGTPYISWLDGSVDEYEVFVRRWIGGH